MLPYLEPEISIENKQLKILYQFTRSIQSYLFEYKNDRMIIVSAESNGVHSASGNFENDHFDFRNGILTSVSGKISQESDTFKKEIIKLNIKPKSLSDFQEMFDWKITDNKYL